MNLPLPRLGLALAGALILSLATGACERRKPPTPNDFPKPSGETPATAPAAAVTVPAENLVATALDADGYSLFVRASFRLLPAFAEYFKGTNEEILTALRRKAFPEGDPGDAMKLALNEDRSILTAQFTGVRALTDSSWLVRYLATSKFWTPTSDPGPRVPAPDPQLAALKMKTAGLTQALLQLDDPNARTRALDEIAADLASTDDGRRLAALNALSSASQVDFERDRFRALVLPLLSSASGEVRASAVSTLLSVNPQPEDLTAVLGLVDDPEPKVQKALPFTIKQLANGDLTGPAGDAELKLLERTIPLERRQFLSSLWGAKFSPALEDKLISMATPFTRDVGYDVMYYSLSTQLNKGEKTVNLLIDCLQDPDVINVGHRALWGLGYGVNAEQQPQVADAVLKFLLARTTDREDCLRILRNYGTASHADALLAFAAKDGLRPELKRQASDVATAIRNRP